MTLSVSSRITSRVVGTPLSLYSAAGVSLLRANNLHIRGENIIVFAGRHTYAFLGCCSLLGSWKPLYLIAANNQPQGGQWSNIYKRPAGISWKGGCKIRVLQEEHTVLRALCRQW